MAEIVLERQLMTAQELERVLSPQRLANLGPRPVDPMETDPK